ASEVYYILHKRIDTLSHTCDDSFLQMLRITYIGAQNAITDLKREVGHKNSVLPVSWNYCQIGVAFRNDASHVLENHLSRFLVFPLERRNDHSPNGCWFGESAAIVGSIEGAMLSASSCRSASSQSSTSWPSPCPLAINNSYARRATSSLVI